MQYTVLISIRWKANYQLDHQILIRRDGLLGVEVVGEENIEDTV